MSADVRWSRRRAIRSIGWLCAGALGVLGVGTLAFAGVRMAATSSTRHRMTSGADALLDMARSAEEEVERTVAPAIERTRLIAADSRVIDAIRTEDVERLTACANRAIQNATEIDAVALFGPDAHILAINTVYSNGRRVPEDRVERVLRRDYAGREIIQGCISDKHRAEAIEFQTSCDITPAYFDSGGLSVAVSVPILDPQSGDQLGVVSSRMRFDRLAPILQSHTIAGGLGSLAFVSDRGEYFDEQVRRGNATPPVDEKSLAEIVRPIAAGQIEESIVENTDTYLALHAMSGIKTLDAGGIIAVASAPAHWVNHEATLARTRDAAALGAAGLLLIFSGAIVGSLLLSSAKSNRLAELQDRFERAVGGASDGLWDYEPNSGAVWCSDRLKELLGYGPDTFDAFPTMFTELLEFVHPEERDHFACALDDHLADMRPFDVTCRLRTRSGTDRWFHIRGRAIASEQGMSLRMAGSIHDVSAHKQTERDLRASETRLRMERALLENILSTLPFFVFWKDRESRYLGCNDNFAKGAGADTPADIIGKTDFDLPWTTAQAEKYREDDRRVMATGVSKLHIEEVQRLADGRTITLSTSKVPLRDEAGDVIGVLGMYVDVTERKNLEAQLVQAQKLESIGQLAAGIAHEINTPTQYISDNVRYLREQFGAILAALDSYAAQLDPDAPAKSWAERTKEIRDLLQRLDYDFLRSEIPQALDQSLEGLERVATIVRAMKDFSHPGTGVKEPTDLNKAIESSATVCRNRWKYVAEMRLDLDEGLPSVPCLVAEINQVILNLVVNAADAIAERLQGAEGEQGVITISTRALPNCVEIRVTDNGCGIPEEFRNRVFDPFFTTKEVGFGTGQGLAICRNVIVEKHAGTLTCSSTPGQGTTFTITLPLEESSAATRAAA